MNERQFSQLGRAFKKDEIKSEVGGTGGSEEVILAVDEREPCFAPNSNATAAQCRNTYTLSTNTKQDTNTNTRKKLQRNTTENVNSSGL